MASKSRRGWVWAVLLALAVGLPFLDKPFHVDDPVVLAVARQVRVDPWRPFAGHLNWGGEPDALFTVTTNPPLVSYYLAPFLGAFGEREVPLHAAMLIFPLILALSVVSLSWRFAGGSAWPLLLVMLSPAVVVSGNLMRDVPAAALSAAALALFVTGVDRRHAGLLFAGSLAAGLAMLTKYSAAALIVPAVAYLGLRREWRLAWSLLPAAVVLGLWCLENLATAHQVHLAMLWQTQGDPASWLKRFWPLWPALGASLLIAPALLAAQTAARRWWVVLMALAAGVLVPLGAGWYFHQSPGWQFTLWSALGAALLVVVCAGLPSRISNLKSQFLGPSPSDSAFLLAWALSLLAFSVFCVPFQAIRHFLPALVPLALLAGGQLAAHPGRWLAGLAGALVLAQGGLAFASGIADCQYADAYRRYAAEAGRRYRGQQVWFAGHWGWQEYASRQGFHLISIDDPVPPAGSLVILPDRVHQSALPAAWEPLLQPVTVRAYRTRLPLRTMDGARHAGFYSLGGLQVPFAFTRDPVLEVFRVFRVGEGP